MPCSFGAPYWLLPFHCLSSGLLCLRWNLGLLELKLELRLCGWSGWSWCWSCGSSCGQELRLELNFNFFSLRPWLWLNKTIHCQGRHLSFKSSQLRKQNIDGLP